MRRVRIAVLTSTVAAACGGSSPSPPVVTPPGGNETITGTERIGWNQPAADAVELATIGYAIYVDGNRTDAADVTCTPTAAATGFPCTARLPVLTAGAHTLQLASFVNDGGLLESARSAPLQVNVVPAAIAGRSADAFALRRLDGDAAAGAERSTPSERSAKASADRSAQRVADGLIDVTDLAFAADGRLFVAERGGTVAVLPANARLTPSRSDDLARTPLRLAATATLLALAIDPEFQRTHSVFAIYTEPGRDGAPAFTLARFREAAGTLADRAVLLDRVPASISPHAALRFAADGTLLAAFGAGVNANRAGDSAPYIGDVLRLSADGTTPKDQPSATPVLADGLVAPSGVAWLPGSHSVWVVDRDAAGVSQLREAGGSQRAFRLPDDIAPSAVAAVPEPAGATGHDLLIASSGSGNLLRVRFDARGQPIGTALVTIADTEGIRALTIGADGALYFATATSLFKVAAGRWASGSFERASQLP